MKKHLPALLISLISISCNEPGRTDEVSDTTVVQDTSAKATEVTSHEQVSGSPAVISSDSLAIFEDLAVDDPEKRKAAIIQVNGIMKKHRDELPNQASYSSMKLFETYPEEFLTNYYGVDNDTRDVWKYYIAAELILRAPENEVKNAQETLSRIEGSCSCEGKQKGQMKAFTTETLKEVERLVKMVESAAG